MRRLTVIAGLMLSVSWAGDNCAKTYEPPELPNVSSLGCRVQLTYEPPNKFYRWHTRVWTKSADGKEWSILYSVREANESNKALKDCDQWMACVNRKIKARKAKRE